MTICNFRPKAWFLKNLLITKEDPGIKSPQGISSAIESHILHTTSIFEILINETSRVYDRVQLFTLVHGEECAMEMLGNLTSSICRKEMGEKKLRKDQIIGLSQGFTFEAHSCARAPQHA